jgi:Tol biopolymer transport system component
MPRMNSRRNASVLLPLLIGLLLCCGCSLGDADLLNQIREKAKSENWVVVLHSSNGISYFDIASNTFSELHSAPSDTIDASYVGFASFNPTGEKVTFAERSGGRRNLVVYDLRSKERDVLLTMPYVAGARWSPSGNRIAFQGREREMGDYNLYLYDSDTKVTSVLVSGGIQQVDSVSWAPDGKQIVYQAGQNDIAVVDLIGRSITRLDKGWYPSWSPNGRYISYITAEGRSPSHVLYDTTTKQKRPILAGESAGPYTIWSPDSQYLAYSSVSRGFWDYVLGFFGEQRYGDLRVFDIETKKKITLYVGGNFYPTDWHRATIAH